jgi:hypothetical protein
MYNTPMHTPKGNIANNFAVAWDIACRCASLVCYQCVASNHQLPHYKPGILSRANLGSRDSFHSI